MTVRCFHGSWILCVVACGDPSSLSMGTDGGGSGGALATGALATGVSVGEGGGEGTSSDGTSTAPMNGLYTDRVKEIVVEVDFEDGAMPHTGSVLLYGDLWSIVETNLQALFAEHPKTLTIDRTHEQMEAVGPLAGEDHSGQEILAFASMYRDETDSEERRTFYVLFLDGYYEKDGMRQPSVLGVSLGHTGVVAMFKPVIDSTSEPRLSEQVVLVHELGHACGLVDNGVPMVSAHRDEEHGAHCSNEDCVMYWTTASTSGVIEFVVDNLTASDKVLFASDCLDDAVAASHD